MRNSVCRLSCRFTTALALVSLAGTAALADPAITGFSRNSAPLKSMITVFGSDLGTAQGSNYVTVGGRGVPILAWTANSVTFLLNPLAWDSTPLALDTAYPVQVVKRVDNKKSNTLNITITSEPAFVNPPGSALPAPSDQPSITGVQSGAFCRNKSNAVAISGAGFGTNPNGSVTVAVPFLNAQNQPFTVIFALPVLMWTENAIEVELQVPAGAQLGSYGITVRRSNGKTASTSINVVNCP